KEAILQALAREFVKTKISPKKNEGLSNNIHEHLKLTNIINQMSPKATGKIDKDKTVQSLEATSEIDKDKTAQSPEATGKINKDTIVQEQKNLWLQMHQIDPKSEKVLCFSKGSILEKGKLGTIKPVVPKNILNNILNPKSEKPSFPKGSILEKGKLGTIKPVVPKNILNNILNPKSEKPSFPKGSILGEGVLGTTQLVAPGDSGFILVKKTLTDCNPELNQPFKYTMNNPHCIPIIPVDFGDKDKVQYMASGGAALKEYILDFRLMIELSKYTVKKVEKIPEMKEFIYLCSSKPSACPKDCISKLKNSYSLCDKDDRKDLKNYLSSTSLQEKLKSAENWQTIKLLDNCKDLYELNRKDIEELIFLIDKDLTKVKVSAQRKFLKKCKDLCKAWQQEMKYSYTDGLLPLKELRHILKNMLTGVNNMHQQGITHGDIHLGNIVTDGDKLYFIDFDDAQYFPEDETKVNNEKFEKAKRKDRKKLYSIVYRLLIAGLQIVTPPDFEDLIRSRPYQHERKTVNELFDVLNKLYQIEPLDEILKLPFFSEY
ncbi:MAG: phosphotransferase, partial [Endozoicomonadaceae bacterium]|nr:phosphotransferase [Endozoicomonadaceae bacterium]